MALQRTPGIKLPPDLTFPRFPRWRGVYLVASGNGALRNFGDWGKPVGCVATAGDNPNPETPFLLITLFDPWIHLVVVGFSGFGAFGPRSLSGFHIQSRHVQIHCREAHEADGDPPHSDGPTQKTRGAGLRR